jgi:hypothetical protein
MLVVQEVEVEVGAPDVAATLLGNCKLQRICLAAPAAAKGRGAA